MKNSPKSDTEDKTSDSVTGNGRPATNERTGASERTETNTNTTRTSLRQQGKPTTDAETTTRYEPRASTSQAGDLDSATDVRKSTNSKRLFPCDHCDKVFTTRQNLLSHLRIHQRVYPFKCDSCEMAFVEYSTLFKHKKTHAKVREKCPCSKCDMSFLSKPGLKKHQLKVHKMVSADFKRGKSSSCRLKAKGRRTGLRQSVLKVGETGDVVVSIPEVSSKNVSNVGASKVTEVPVVISTETDTSVATPVVAIATSDVTMTSPVATTTVEISDSQVPVTSVDIQTIVKHEGLKRSTRISSQVLSETLGFKASPRQNVNDRSESVVSESSDSSSSVDYESEETSSGEFIVRKRTRKPKTMVTKLRSSNKENTRISYENRSGRFSCQLCPESFPQVLLLKTHVETSHLDSNRYCCAKCDRIFANPKALAAHSEKHVARTFKCKTCEKVFAQKITLDGHQRVHTGEQPFECDVCFRRFAHYQSRDAHMRLHTREKLYRCQICNFKTSWRSSMTTHLLQHKGERPHKCKQCALRFTQKSQLKRHVQGMHNPEKKCKICGDYVKNRKAMVAHLAAHNGDTPFECEDCDEGFLKMFQLKKHVLETHTLPNRCKCGAAFAYPSGLKAHKLSHTHARDLKCEYADCGARFARVSNLNAHIRLHTGNLPFACDLCECKYNRRALLIVHVRNFHEGKIKRSAPRKSKYRDKVPSQRPVTPEASKISTKQSTASTSPDTKSKSGSNPKVVSPSSASVSVTNISQRHSPPSNALTMPIDKAASKPTAKDSLVTAKPLSCPKRRSPPRHLRRGSSSPSPVSARKMSNTATAPTMNSAVSIGHTSQLIDTVEPTPMETKRRSPTRHLRRGSSSPSSVSAREESNTAADPPKSNADSICDPSQPIDTVEPALMETIRRSPPRVLRGVGSNSTSVTAREVSNTAADPTMNNTISIGDPSQPIDTVEPAAMETKRRSPPRGFMGVCSNSTSLAAREVSNIATEPKKNNAVSIGDPSQPIDSVKRADIGTKRLSPPRILGCVSSNSTSVSAREVSNVATDPTKNNTIFIGDPSQPIDTVKRADIGTKRRSPPRVLWGVSSNSTSLAAREVSNIATEPKKNNAVSTGDPSQTIDNAKPAEMETKRRSPPRILGGVSSNFTSLPARGISNVATDPTKNTDFSIGDQSQPIDTVEPALMETNRRSPSRFLRSVSSNSTSVAAREISNTSSGDQSKRSPKTVTIPCRETPSQQKISAEPAKMDPVSSHETNSPLRMSSATSSIAANGKCLQLSDNSAATFIPTSQATTTSPTTGPLSKRARIVSQTTSNQISENRPISQVEDTVVAVSISTTNVTDTAPLPPTSRPTQSKRSRRVSYTISAEAAEVASLALATDTAIPFPASTTAAEVTVSGAGRTTPPTSSSNLAVVVQDNAVVTPPHVINISMEQSSPLDLRVNSNRPCASPPATMESGVLHLEEGQHETLASESPTSLDAPQLCPQPIDSASVSISRPHETDEAVDEVGVVAGTSTENLQGARFLPTSASRSHFTERLRQCLSPPKTINPVEIWTANDDACFTVRRVPADPISPPRTDDEIAQNVTSELVNIGPSETNDPVNGSQRSELHTYNSDEFRDTICRMDETEHLQPYLATSLIEQRIGETSGIAKCVQEGERMTSRQRADSKNESKRKIRDSSDEKLSVKRRKVTTFQGGKETGKVVGVRSGLARPKIEANTLKLKTNSKSRRMKDKPTKGNVKGRPSKKTKAMPRKTAKAKPRPMKQEVRVSKETIKAKAGTSKSKSSIPGNTTAAQKTSKNYKIKPEAPSQTGKNAKSTKQSFKPKVPTKTGKFKGTKQSTKPKAPSKAGKKAKSTKQSAKECKQSSIAKTHSNRKSSPVSQSQCRNVKLVLTKLPASSRIATPSKVSPRQTLVSKTLDTLASKTPVYRKASVSKTPVNGKKGAVNKTSGKLTRSDGKTSVNRTISTPSKPSRNRKTSALSKAPVKSKSRVLSKSPVDRETSALTKPSANSTTGRSKPHVTLKTAALSPVNQRKFAPSKTPVNRKKSTHSKTHVNQRKSAPSKFPVNQMKSSLSRTPVNRKKSAPSRTPVNQRKYAPSKTPVIRMKSAPTKSPVSKRKSALSKTPVNRGKSAPPKTPANKGVPSETPATKRITAANKRKVSRKPVIRTARVGKKNIKSTAPVPGRKRAACSEELSSPKNGPTNPKRPALKRSRILKSTVVVQDLPVTRKGKVKQLRPRRKVSDSRNALK